MVNIVYYVKHTTFERKKCLFQEKYIIAGLEEE